jgi:predicted aspartyl protease
MSNIQASESEAEGFPEKIITSIEIYKDEKIEDRKTIKALWDTGANHSVINSKFIEEFSLKGRKSMIVKTLAGETRSKLYKINIKLSGQNFGSIALSDRKLDKNEFDLLIGMDIISKGEFRIYKNKKSKVILSFIPYLNKK